MFVSFSVIHDYLENMGGVSSVCQKKLIHCVRPLEVDCRCNFLLFCRRAGKKVKIARKCGVERSEEPELPQLI